VTALVGAAVGRALAAEPTLNGRIAFGRYIPFDDVVVSFLVQMDEGSDLAQVRVEGADAKTVAEVSRDLHARAARLRSGHDEAYERSKKTMQLLPTWALRRVLALSGFVTSGLGRPAFGQPAFPFGAAIITSVGMLGIDEAFVPPTPFARVPVYVAVGAIRPMVFVEEGAPVVRPGITLTCTLDHRFVDGFQAGTLAREMRRCFSDPASLGPLPARGPAASEVTESPAS
jgi:pyruvate dehydrogenase E2 component (dihydrolipoamide acetyltransferase)